jgi:hypothetical protein
MIVMPVSSADIADGLHRRVRFGGAARYVSGTAEILVCAAGMGTVGDAVRPRIGWPGRLAAGSTVRFRNCVPQPSPANGSRSCDIGAGVSLSDRRSEGTLLRDDAGGSCWWETIAGQLVITLRKTAMRSENTALKTLGGRYHRSRVLRANLTGRRRANIRRGERSISYRREPSCSSVRSCLFHDTGGDPDTVHEYAHRLEAAGYDFLEAPDHVLGANVASRPGWDPDRNTSQDLFHDLFVLLSYLSGVTSKTRALHRCPDNDTTSDSSNRETGGMPRRAM